MATRRQTSISETELDVLKVLWDRGPGTVREIQEALRPLGRRWAYTTVQTLLHRLEGKGFVASDRRAAAHVFCAAVSREQLLQQRLTDLSDQLCSGEVSPLVLALVEGVRFTPEEIEQFRKLLDQLEDSSEDRPSKK
ncbi:MAG TPA: BlaI/MecI/CopY family transcriptional regulator [Gemmataceae bacterium]|nr:BlaI/MecI/CopY family transcriptional regulator [Gemmataceae bacterium]